MGSKTKLDDVVDFCAKELEIPVHVATASRLMRELGFSSRKMQAKSSGFSVDVDGAVEMAYQWLAVHHNSFIPSKVWSIDCVFTGHRTDTHKSFVVSGGPPANFSGSISSYTALGVTLVCDDGRYFPTVLYTSNPIFNRDRSQTARRKGILANIEFLFR